MLIIAAVSWVIGGLLYAALRERRVRFMGKKAAYALISGTLCFAVVNALIEALKLEEASIVACRKSQFRCFDGDISCSWPGNARCTEICGDRMRGRLGLSLVTGELVGSEFFPGIGFRRFTRLYCYKTTPKHFWGICRI